jgi:glycosyltransferase involved in cell wall biosynthesis
MEPDFDVVFVGQVVGIDLMFAEHFARRGMRCCVARPSSAAKTAEMFDGFDRYHRSYSLREIAHFANAAEFLAIARRSRLVVSLGGGALGVLRWRWPLRRLLGFPPIVAATTGSDLAETAGKRGWRGAIYRRYLRSVDLNAVVPYPAILANLLAHRIPNVAFLRYPYYLLEPARRHASSPQVRFLHASHLDWKANDPGEHRVSSKGNDRFLRAFARAVSNGLDAHCVILDRGPDREIAKQLVSDLGVGDRFSWKGHLTRDELLAEMASADVVVDQFEVGGFGGIALEAMSLGRPVMIHIDAAAARIVYGGDDPPILNCHTEDEIYHAVMRSRDRNEMARLGDDAAVWARRNHGDSALDEWLFHFSLLTGHRFA